MLKVWALNEMSESDEVSEIGMEDEATTSTSSGSSQCAGNKRSRQSTPIVTKKSKQ